VLFPNALRFLVYHYDKARRFKVNYVSFLQDLRNLANQKNLSVYIIEDDRNRMDFKPQQAKYQEE